MPHSHAERGNELRYEADMRTTEIQSITGMFMAELEALCVSLGEPAYRAKQILSWVYDKGATGFDEMSNLPKRLMAQMGERCRVFQTKADSVTQTAEGAEKFLVCLPDENVIECVLLREGRRITACVSTQVGCAMACRFCASGLPGLERNLTAGEIVEQVLHVKNHLSPEERLTNVVFMGIGEPLANYGNVIRAVRIINADWGLKIGARHITISTVGVVEGIRRLAQEGLQVNLAISLHAPDDTVRSGIIPSNKKTGVKNILAAAREYFAATGRDVSFEYVLIRGVNDSKQDAENLARQLKGIQCNVNVLPLNPVQEFALQPPGQDAVETFCKVLERSGIVVTVRKKKGGRINAACGQLRLLNTHGISG